VPVAPAPVVEPDAHLEDALVEIANRVCFDDPQAFQGFMLLKEFSSVELLDTREQTCRRQVLAPAGATWRRLFRWPAQAEAWLPIEARTLSPSGEAAGSSR
jgi:hypothetical protein